MNSHLFFLLAGAFVFGVSIAVLAIAYWALPIIVRARVDLEAAEERATMAEIRLQTCEAQLGQARKANDYLRFVADLNGETALGFLLGSSRRLDATPDDAADWWKLGSREGREGGEGK